MTIIRSIAHEFADHGGGHKRFLTGYNPKEPTGFVNDNPNLNHVLTQLNTISDVLVKHKAGLADVLATAAKFMGALAEGALEAGGEIIGVMPRGFALVGNEDIWLPLDIKTEIKDVAPTLTALISEMTPAVGQCSLKRCRP